MANSIELISIEELSGMSFYIPNYQRGYRWTPQQVKDLLGDIQEFIDKKQGGFYSIQPLVIKKGLPKEKGKDFKNKFNQIKENENILNETEKLISEYTKWEVIDGQQRLTTIFLIVKYLMQENLYDIEYETRNTEQVNSKKFLEEIETIKNEDSEVNIDYCHIYTAYRMIKNWFIRKTSGQKEEFLKTLLNDVKFIWYESVDEDPIKVFTRLNIGKIALTNAELIKALFLNKSNFDEFDYQKIRLQQQEIAGEWDTIEYTLQNDEFWLFLNKVGYDKPTRIDFIFDLICEKNTLNLSEDKLKDIGTDEYRTFRYFYAWFKSKEAITVAWSEVKTLFQTFKEWFNDLKLYHYVGFLVATGTGITKILDDWNEDGKTKKYFLEKYIHEEIRGKLQNCSDLNKQYDKNGNPKTQCKPILLLHNIQTVIKQNKSIKETEKYKLPVFYKFPFHLFKSEKWDVEHIDSNTENTLENDKAQKEWLKYSYEFIPEDYKLDSGEKLKNEIIKFVSKEEENKDFSYLHEAVLEATSEKDENKLSDEEKNKVWNFTLLDAGTNRGYGNAIFPAKRRILIGKDQGKTITVSEQFDVKEEEGAIAFIPPCTRNVFLKYYNPATNNLREWDKSDAEAYLENIKSVLKEFLDKEN